MNRLKKLTANGLLFPGQSGTFAIRGLRLQAGGGAAASCDIREGGSTGPIVSSLAAPVNQAAFWAVKGPFVLVDPYLDNLTGAGASVGVAY
jgi:hypothetical protein